MKVLFLILVAAFPELALGQSNDANFAAILQRVRERVARHYLDLQSMSFESPHQTIVVPGSLEFATTITKGKDDVNLYRTTHTFTNYKRFSGDAKVIAAEGTTK